MCWLTSNDVRGILQMQSLAELSLSHCGRSIISDTDAIAFPSSPSSLTKLSLYGPDIQLFTPCVSLLTNLKYLYLRASGAEGEHQPLRGHLPALETLDVHVSLVPAFFDDTPTTSLPSLRTLTVALGTQSIRNDGTWEVDWLVKLLALRAGLRCLEIETLGVTDEAVDDLLHMLQRQLPTLKVEKGRMV